MQPLSLSVIVITHNEAAHLGDCLDSVRGLADELVVVDSGSTDNTIELARQRGAQVIQTADWPGFGPQKNRALDAAQGRWILSLDADERLTPALSAEIRQVLEQDPEAAFEMPRSSFFCGKFMRHGGWYPDRVLRLFQKKAGRFSEDWVHEKVLARHPVRRLKSDLLHYSYRSFEQVLAKSNRYSSDAAAQMLARGQNANWVSALGHGFWAFVRTYVLRAGFLDGAHGLALAIFNAQTSYYKYLKLWQMNQERRQTSEMKE